MQVGAKVESIDALAVFRVALIKFQEAATAALGDAESDVLSTQRWLDNDQFSYWSSQIRSRQEAVVRAQEALRQKQIFKDSSGRVPSAVEEQKILTKAQHRLAEAQEKMAAVKSWQKRLQKEGLLFKGQVQRFSTSVAQEIPSAIGHLGALIHTLQEYLAMTPGGDVEISGDVAAYFTEGGGGASMSRGGSAKPADTRPFVHLRGRGPATDARSHATPAQPAPAQWAAPVLSDEDIKHVGELPITWTAITDGEKIILARGAAQSGGIFLERARGAASGDSGWYIASIDPTEPALETITVAELLAARPDLRQILSMPPGFLTVIDRGGIAAILNDRDDNVLTAKPAPV